MPHIYSNKKPIIRTCLDWDILDLIIPCVVPVAGHLDWVAVTLNQSQVSCPIDANSASNEMTIEAHSMLYLASIYVDLEPTNKSYTTAMNGSESLLKRIISVYISKPITRMLLRHKKDYISTAYMHNKLSRQPWNSLPHKTRSTEVTHTLVLIF